MRWKVRVTEGAWADIRAAAGWIAEHASQQEADRWVDGILHGLAELRSFPRRCSLAVESDTFPQSEIRQLLLGSYRALFLIRGSTAFVLFVRHGHRLPADLTEISTRARAVETDPGTP